MRFSAYFEEAARLSAADPARAAELLREAEAHSLTGVPEHLNLCARIWMTYLKNRDNAMRCLLLNECRTAPDDQAALLEITEAYLAIVRDFSSAERCFQKALAAARPAEPERLRVFLEKYGRRGENDALYLESADDGETLRNPAENFPTNRMLRSGSTSSAVDRRTQNADE